MGDISNEPSMEEILSSIKKIIAEDSVRAVAPSRRAPVRDVQPEPLVPEPLVLAQAEPVADSVPEEILELTENAPEELSEADLVSNVTAEASRSALASLSKMVVKPEVSGSDTLEGMVRDMLRPMLKDWLDANLPGIVEGVVAKEVARISGRGL
jgi:uncharacterized protein